MNHARKSPVSRLQDWEKVPEGGARGFAVDVEHLLDVVQRHVSMRPEAISALREELLSTISRSGRPVGTLLPEGDQVLSTQEAADLVGVSRPFMAARIDAGDVPLFQQVGNQRRVLASSVHAWHEQSRARRLKAMSDLGRGIEDEYRRAD